MSATPNLYSISPEQNYLKTLVDALLDGKLIEGYAPRGNPLELSRATIYVPTRRAARALNAHFATAMGGKATLLPNIKPLGDVNEDELLLTSDDLALNSLDDMPTVGNFERQILLAKLIERWADVLEQNSKSLFEEPIAMPASTKDAIWLASDLAGLMDQMETENIGWDAIPNLAPDEHAEWWKLTLGFLKIASQFWPQHMREKKRISSVHQRNEKLYRQAKFYQSTKTDDPVIAAGSTGSIPATAALLKSIGFMNKGAVILPGLDFDMSEEAWQILGQDKTDPTLPSHPQYGLYHLLKNFSARREDVTLLENDPSLDTTRRQIISHSLLPSNATQIWPEFTDHIGEDNLTKACAKITTVQAANEHQEAVSIALILRETLEHKDKTAALITPDRNLARRVITELKRFNITANDSAGRPLVNTPCGKLLTLLLEVCFKPKNPVALLSLMKHSLCQLGWEKRRAAKAAKSFELIAIRGQIQYPTACECAHYYEKALINLEGKPYTPQSVNRLSSEAIKDAQEFAALLDAALSPLMEIQKTGDGADIADLVKATITAYNELVKGENENQFDAYQGDDGEALSGFFKAMLNQTVGDKNLETTNTFFDGFKIPFHEWPDIFDAFMIQVSVRVRASTHPNIAIWGPLEARLQSVDRVILSGLNEGTWPAGTKNNPFLSRSMKLEIDLDPPERRIGLASHDFQMAMGNDEVFLTRSERLNDAPTVPSRWLQRLNVVAGISATELMIARGKYWVNMAQKLDDTKEHITIDVPNPKPPIDARPKGLSITEIETWIRDPYAIYAKHILNLEALQPIYREADARERGTLYHKVFERFTQEVKRPYSFDASLAQLLNIGKEEFQRSQLDIDIRALWWPRFKEIAKHFIIWEINHNQYIQKSLVEISLKAMVPLHDFILRGRLDRIDINADGSLTILDYKTGMNPSDKQVQTLFAPQLPLEGALTIFNQKNQFDDVQIQTLLYPRLRIGDELIVTHIGAQTKEFDAHQLCLDAWKKLSNLVATYQDPEKGYISRAHPFKENDFSSDYDHLARVLEWSIGKVDSGEI
jgi:ATP-dependent helicase/nuclease subunit B